MVGYSALAQKNDALSLELLQEQRHLRCALFPKCGGKEIDTTGDTFFVEFSSALQDVRCAYEIQTTFHWCADRPRYQAFQVLQEAHQGLQTVD
jgi:hypothetical protein